MRGGHVRVGAALAATAAILLVVVNPTTAGASTPTAVHFEGTATVGALFPSSSSTVHTCTASVVDSPLGDVIMTAAHCVTGRATGDVFVPGYRKGSAPYGTWHVVAAYGSEGWVTSHDPQADFAFLVVADRTIGGRTRSIESVTGANELGTYPSGRDVITLPAYDAGRDDLPITCTTGIHFTGTYPAFDCNPYVDGTSGAPWLWRSGGREYVVGVIGGLHHGGCSPAVSYSPGFGSDLDGVYKEAATGAPAMVFPGPGSDGCSTGL